MGNIHAKCLALMIPNIANHSNSIFHYTTPLGLKNILESQSLWFSNIKYLNDKEELLYTELLSKNIAMELYKHDQSDFLKEISNENLKLHEICFPPEAYIIKETGESNEFMRNKLNQALKFVACFSKNRDSLSLWNYYTKNPENIGYNIEFAYEGLFSSLIKSSSVGINMGCVIYDLALQTKLIKKAIIEYNEAYKNCRNEKEKIECKISYWYLIDDFSVFFKHSAFSAEEEIRMILDYSRDLKPPFDKIKFRECKGFFIPYTELSFEKKCVKSITISPTQKQEIAVNSIEFLKDCLGYSNVNFNKSKIPLRY